MTPASPFSMTLGVPASATRETAMYKSSINRVPVRERSETVFAKATWLSTVDTSTESTRKLLELINKLSKLEANFISTNYTIYETTKEGETFGINLTRKRGGNLYTENPKTLQTGIGEVLLNGQDTDSWLRGQYCLSCCPLPPNGSFEFLQNQTKSQQAFLVETG